MKNTAVPVLFFFLLCTLFNNLILTTIIPLFARLKLKEALKADLTQPQKLCRPENIKERQYFPSST